MLPVATPVVLPLDEHMQTLALLIADYNLHAQHAGTESDASPLRGMGTMGMKLIVRPFFSSLASNS